MGEVCENCVLERQFCYFRYHLQIQVFSRIWLLIIAAFPLPIDQFTNVSNGCPMMFVGG